MNVSVQRKQCDDGAVWGTNTWGAIAGEVRKAARAGGGEDAGLSLIGFLQPQDVEQVECACGVARGTAGGSSTAEHEAEDSVVRLLLAAEIVLQETGDLGHRFKRPFVCGEEVAESLGEILKGGEAV